MREDKLNRLKEVLSIPTKSRQEDLMINYLKGVLTERGYTDASNPNETPTGNYFKVDRLGNIYVTKGTAEFYPCFVSHTDTVHDIDHNMTVIETRDNEKNITILTGVNKETLKPSGIGGDDKCGVYLCLEMLDTFENVKAAFFVSEEIGCIGSKIADKDFFSNVGYAIQYDSPEGDSMSFTLMSKELFGTESEFGTKVGGLIREHGINNWARHPYTDIWQLLEKFDFSCLNLAAGYYRMHTASEFVIVEDVQNSYELGVRLVNELGENKYERPPQLITETRPWWSRYYGGGGGRYYNPDPDPDPVPDLNQRLLTEGDDETDGNNEFEDLFDYEDFNGGYSIKHYGSLDDFDIDFDW